jgi:hypothetical protein
MKFAAILIAAIPMLMSACGAKTGTVPTTESVATTATFNADSAYSYLVQQVHFGPRTPRSEAHRACGLWLEKELARHGADTVVCQDAVVDNHLGGTIPVHNIMAQYNSRASKRIVLLAHWDTRPVADNDPDPAKRSTAIDGANDGASGVAVLLEIARQLGIKAPAIGVDILLCDAEDSGAHDVDDSWAIGTAYWASHLPYTDVFPSYGILLDMVGGKGARFHREYFSQRNAGAIVDKVWNTAKALGHDSSFIDAVGGAITDDHIPVNEAGIPCIDIIECYNEQTGAFNPTWHTTADNLDNIDTTTLSAVGSTLINVIYNERP